MWVTDFTESTDGIMIVTQHMCIPSEVSCPRLRFHPVSTAEPCEFLAGVCNVGQERNRFDKNIVGTHRTSRERQGMWGN